MFNKIFTGFGLVLSSFSYINRNKMSYVYLVTIALMILLMLGGMALLTAGIDYVKNLIEEWIMSPSLPEWVLTTIKIIAAIILWVISLMLMSIIIGYTIIIVMSPLFSKIAETTYKIETGNEVKGGIKRFMYCIWRGIAVAIRNLFWQMLILLGLFIVGFIPILGIITPIITILVNSYFFGLSMFDYSMEARDMNISESTHYARGDRGLILGIGLPFTLLLIIPFIGPYLAIIFAPATVVASARYMHKRELLQLENKQ